LRALPEEPQFDLAFIDADKESYIAYWEELVPRVRPGGVLLADNVFSHSRVLDPAQTAARVPAIRDFNVHARADTRVDLVPLPIADGLTLAPPSAPPRTRAAGRGAAPPLPSLYPRWRRPQCDRLPNPPHLRLLPRRLRAPLSAAQPAARRRASRRGEKHPAGPPLRAVRAGNRTRAH